MFLKPQGGGKPRSQATVQLAEPLSQAHKNRSLSELHEPNPSSSITLLRQEIVLRLNWSRFGSGFRSSSRRGRGTWVLEGPGLRAACGTLFSLQALAKNTLNYSTTLPVYCANLTTAWHTSNCQPTLGASVASVLTRDAVQGSSFCRADVPEPRVLRAADRAGDRSASRALSSCSLVSRLRFPGPGSRHLYIHTYIHTHVCPCLCLCLSISISICICTCVCVCICICICIGVGVGVGVGVGICLCTRICIGIGIRYP